MSESSERSRRWSRAEAWLIATSLSMGALAAVSLTALALDPRVLPSGELVWWKPLRFASAFAVHAVTLCWLSRATDRPGVDDRWFRWAAFLQIVAMFFELVLIALQALRGVPSHFNVATPLDGAVFGLMGIGTGGLFVGWGMMIWGALRQPGRATAPRLMTRAMIAGLAFAILGGLVGVHMVQPTAAQQAQLAAGEALTLSGSHATEETGGASASNGLFGWETRTGDWRLAHFLGIHALQILPVLTWFGLRFAARHAASIWGIAVVAYASLLGWVLRGTSVNVPPHQLLAAPATTAIVSLVIVLLAVGILRSRADTPSVTRHDG